MPIFNKKYEREEEKRGREKMLNFDNVKTEIPLLNSCWLVVKCALSAQSEKKKKKKLWQTNCDNAIAEIGEKKFFVTIVAMALPKMRGGGMWFWNLGRVKKKSVMFTIFSQ